MKIRLFSVTAAAWLALTTIAFAQGGAPARGPSGCDRACLMGIADAYFAALVAHDPSKAPMAPNAKFSEQTRELKVGEGLWKTTTEGPTAFKIPVPARAGGPPPPSPPYAVQLALRLKVENRRKAWSSASRCSVIR